MMDFIIDKSPPNDEAIKLEKERILVEIKQIKQRDTLISFIFIVIISVVMAALIYWTTDNITYATVAVLAFPVLSIILNLFGIAANMGFRSAEKQLIDLNHELVALTPISDNNHDITNLSAKYKEVSDYRERTKEIGRHLVNGELAMFWEWDVSTMAKQDKAKAYVEQAKKSVSSE